MYKSNFFGFSFIIFPVVLFSLSCGNNAKTDVPKQDTALVSTGPDSNKTAVASSNLLRVEGVLDTLYTNADTFKLLPNRRVIFKYFINSDADLTLKGWPTGASDDQYDASKLLELKTGTPVTYPKIISYGPGDYLGGVMLGPLEVAAIKLKIVKYPTLTYLHFIPSYDPNFSGHFIYDLFLADYIPNGSQNLTKHFQDIKVAAKPSPPRNSSR